MIDYSTLRKSIEEEISAGSVSIPVEYENTFIDPPDAEHIKLSISDIDSRHLELGSDSRLVEALLTFSIMVKKGSGTDKIREVASELCTVLSGDPIENVVFTGGVELVSVGTNEDSPLYQYNLVMPITYTYTG